MNKLICILLCILLISLSIVPVFADTYSEITPETFVSLFESISGADLTLVTNDLYNFVPAEIRNSVEQYDYDVFSYTFTSSYPNIIYFSYSPIPDGFYDLSMHNYALPGCYSLEMSDAPNVMRRNIANYYNGTVSNDSPQSGKPCMIIWGSAADSHTYIYFKNDVQFSLNGSNYIVKLPVSVNPSNPNYPTNNPYYPTVPTDWDNYTEMIAGLLYDNFKFTCNNTVYNSTWMPVGEYLMYDFLCKNNPQNDTVSFNNWEYQNYVYRICGLNHEDDVITIMELLDDINYYHGNYLASISNSLNYDPEYDLGFAYNVITPLNKIAQVYASDQEIEAREAAADNQQAIVDNFLDSEGDGYVSPSNISSVSSMSDGYKTHMSTDAQPSGIWDIFNSNNFGWFSQETVNQLDTTTSNQRGSNTFETPYLDEKIRDIYKSLGVNYDD